MWKKSPFAPFWPAFCGAQLSPAFVRDVWVSSAELGCYWVRASAENLSSNTPRIKPQKEDWWPSGENKIVVVKANTELSWGGCSKSEFEANARWARSCSHSSRQGLQQCLVSGQAELGECAVFVKMLVDKVLSTWQKINVNLGNVRKEIKRDNG